MLLHSRYLKDGLNAEISDDRQAENYVTSHGKKAVKIKPFHSVFHYCDIICYILNLLTQVSLVKSEVKLYCKHRNILGVGVSVFVVGLMQEVASPRRHRQFWQVPAVSRQFQWTLCRTQPSPSVELVVPLR